MPTEIPRNRIIRGHVLDVLRSLPDESVDCVATSPPYWNLRNYNTEPQIWGADPRCVHEWETERILETRGVDGSTLDGDFDPEANRFDIEWSVCRICRAWRGHLGLEAVPDCFAWARGESPCPECYCCHLRSVFAEVRRLLRPHGTLWINIGDSYTSGSRKYRDPGRSWIHEAQRGAARQPTPPGLKSKDLVGAPWSLAFALRSDGFYLRNDNIWAKAGCMPTSAKDRSTVSHEYVFMFSKEEAYFYDGYAVREPAITAASGNKKRRVADGDGRMRLDTHLGSSIPWADDGSGRNKRTVWRVAGQQFGMATCRHCEKVYERMELNGLAVSEDGTKVCGCGKSDGWVSHSAVFPEDLVATAILAGTSERGCCGDCGSPWRRIVERATIVRPLPTGRRERDGNLTNRSGFDRTGVSHRKMDDFLANNPPRTAGWELGCSCCRICDTMVPNHALQKQGRRPRLLEKKILTAEAESLMGRKTQTSPQESEEKVRPLFPDLQRKGCEEPVLQQDVLGKVDVVQGPCEPLHQGGVREIQDSAQKGEVYPGTSACDGEASEKRTEDTPHVQAEGHEVDPYNVVRALVLDPFIGTGTTALVALKAARDFVGIELNEDSVRIAERRIAEEMAQSKLF